MTTKLSLIKILGAMLLGAAPLAARAQGYSLNWYKIAGGGGASSNGTYVVNGTIGQPDAGAASGGNYSMQGGFWAGITVTSSNGVPTLVIQPATGGVTISWSPNTTGFVLEETASLSSPSWSPSLAGNPVTLSISGGAKFYRLRKQ